MSDRWQADNQLAAPRTGRRLIPLLALCVLLVGAGGLILWATGSNSAAGVSPSVTALVQTSNEIEALHAKLDALAQSASEMTAPSAGAAVPSPKATRKGRN